MLLFHNEAETSVEIYINSEKSILEPNEVVDIPCSSPTTVLLKHRYPSSALPEKEIACDDLDTSLVSLALSSHKKPYFNIVLDCVYEIEFEEQAQVYIQKEIIRPIYECAYDRLYPFVQHGVTREKYHTFPQKKKYEQHYLKAVSSGNRKIVKIVLIILSLSSLPLVLLFFLTHIVAGAIAMGVVGCLLFLLHLIGTGICKLMCKLDCSIVFSSFDSNKIIGFFNDSK